MPSWERTGHQYYEENREVGSVDCQSEEGEVQYQFPPVCYQPLHLPPWQPYSWNRGNKWWNPVEIILLCRLWYVACLNTNYKFCKMVHLSAYRHRLGKKLQTSFVAQNVLWLVLLFHFLGSLETPRLFETFWADCKFFRLSANFPTYLEIFQDKV